MARVGLSRVIVTGNKEQGIFNDVGLSTFQKFTFVEQFYRLFFFFLICYEETMEIILFGQSPVTGLSEAERRVMQIDCINQKPLNYICF